MQHLMTSTHHFHPSFDSLSPSKLLKRRNRSQSLRTQSTENNGDSKSNDNKCSLPSIVELKPFNHKKHSHRSHDRSQSFQITGYNNKGRMKTRKLINTISKQSANPVIPVPNTNINRILIDGADVDTKRRKHKLFGSKRRKNLRKSLNHNRSNALSMTQQLSNFELSDHGHFPSHNLMMNVQGNKYEQSGSPKSIKDHMEYPLDITTIVNQSVEAKFTLAFLVKNFPRETTLKVMRHPKTRQNPGWFSSQFLNSQDSEGNTAMHMCCTIGDYQLCDLLIQYSALINVLNFKRQTALDLAIETRNCRIVELLLKNRAIPGHQYYDNPERYESDLSIKIKSLMNIYLHPMVHPALTANSDPTFHANAFIPPIHLYEKPMVFRNQHCSTADEHVNDIVSELSSPPTSSRWSRRAHCVDLDDFFNSGVNFMI